MTASARNAEKETTAGIANAQPLRKPGQPFRGDELRHILKAATIIVIGGESGRSSIPVNNPVFYQGTAYWMPRRSLPSGSLKTRPAGGA